MTNIPPNPIQEEIEAELHETTRNCISDTIRDVYDLLDQCNDNAMQNMIRVERARDYIDSGHVLVLNEINNTKVGGQFLQTSLTFFSMLRDVVDLVSLLSTHESAVEIRNLSYIQRVNMDINRDVLLNQYFREEVTKLVEMQNSCGVSIISRLTGIDPNDPRMYRFQLTYPEREDSSDEA